MKKILLGLTVIFLLLLSVDGFAQCSMCRRVAESSHDAHDNKVGRGLNSGILYLMSIPYLLGGVGAFIWYKNRRKD